MVQIGERVGALYCIENKNGKRIAKIFGFGIYLGKKVPETDDVKFFGISLKEINRANPCILLDNGKKVYGCECWWGSETKIKEIINMCDEVVYVDIEKVRRGEE
jgi:hypothetical protein